MSKTEKKLWRFTTSNSDNASKSVDLSYYNNNDEKMKLLNRAMLDKRLNAIEVRVYMYLINNQYIDTQDTIADDLSVSRITVNRSLSRLESLGYIEINVTKRNVAGRIQSKTEYKVLKDVQLINSIEKLYNFIDNKYSITSSSKPIGYNYTDEERIDILKEEFEKFIGSESRFKCSYRHRDLETKVNESITTWNKDVNKALKILAFAIKLEEKYCIRFYTEEFVKHSILDIDRNVMKLDRYQIMYFMCHSQWILRRKKYSITEALDVLNVNYSYSSDKKKKMIKNLETSRDALLEYIKDIKNIEELYIEEGQDFSDISDTLSKIKFKNYINDNDELVEPELDITEVLLLAILFEDDILDEFEKVYRMSYYLMLISATISGSYIADEYSTLKRCMKKVQFTGKIKFN